MSVQKAILVELFALLLVLFGLTLSMEVEGLPYLSVVFGLVFGTFALFFGLMTDA